MPAYVASLSATLDDQVSAGAAVASAAMDKMADSADRVAASTDTVNASVTKAGPSATALANSLDPATKAAKALTDAQNRLAAAQATMTAAVDSGSKTQEQADAVTASLTARVRNAQAAVDALGVSSSEAAKQISGVGDANAEAATQADRATGAHAGFYREIVVMGHEILTGNYSRLGGSMVVLAERTGGLETAMKSVGAWAQTAGGIFTIMGAAGVAAFTYMAVSADNAQNRLQALQDQLSATHDDYVKLAGITQAAAAGAVRTTPGLDSATANIVAKQFSDNPDFGGTEGQLAHLVQLSSDLSHAFGDTIEKAGTELAAAMEAPGAAAEKLVGRLSNMTQSLADSIKLQDESGDKAGAFARVIDTVSARVGGLSQSITPLREAMRDLKNVFDDAATAGQKSGEGIGGAFDNLATKIVQLITTALTGLRELHDYLGTIEPWTKEYAATPQGVIHQFTDSQSAATIGDTGRALGATPDQIAFFDKVALQESGGTQYDQSGNVLTSPKGALGEFQVLPGTAAQFGQDPTTEAGNISAGEQYLLQLSQKYHGNQGLVALAYNWGPDNVDKWIAAGSQGAVPTESANYVQAVAGVTPQQAAGGPGSAAAGVSGAGVVNTNQAVIDQALAKTNGSLESNRQQLQATIELYTKAEDAIRATGMTTDQSAEDFTKISDALAAAKLALENATSPLSKLTDQIDRQIAGNVALAASYDKGHAAVAELTARNQALAEAQTTVGKTSANYGAVVDELTAKNLQLAESQGKVQVSQQTLSNNDNLDYIQAETSAIGLSNDKRTELLDHLKAEQDLRDKLVPELSAEGQAYLKSADAVSAATAALQQQQQTLATLDQLSTQVFDQVGSAITNAFASGGKSALDFGNLARSVLTSVLQEVLKLGALNPVLNSLLGGSRTTLSDVTGLLGGGSSDSGTVTETLPVQQIGGLTSYISPIDQNGTAVSSGGIGGGFGSSSGGGLFSIFGGQGGGGIGGLLGLGGTVTESLPYQQIGGLTSYISPIDETGAAVSSGIGGATSSFGGVASGIGGFVGGAGVGAAAGSLLASFDGGNAQNGQIGADVGAVAGAAIGSIIPGVGTLVGGLIGGLIGGGAGSLFGGKPSDKTEWNYQDFGTGKITAGGSTGSEASSQNSQAAASLTGAVYSAESSISTAFNLPTAVGGVTAKVGNRDGIFIELNTTGQKYSAGNTAAGAASVTNQAVDAVITNFGDAVDSTVAGILKGIDYSKAGSGQTVQALAAATTNGHLDATQLQALPHINTSDATAEINDLTFIKSTYEPAAQGDVGSVATATKQLTDQYTAIIAHATQLGLATDTLVSGEATQIQKVADAAQAQSDSITAGITAQQQTLNGDKLGAALTTFDNSAAQQRTSLTNTLTGLFGAAYTASAQYAQQMGSLNTLLAGQRADIIAQQTQQGIAANDSARATYAGIVAAEGKAYGVIGNDGSQAGAANQAAQNEAADLFTFDANAVTAADSFSAQLISTYGQSYTTTANYAADMAQLESSLAAQRLAIQAQYNDAALQQTNQAAQSAASVVSGLTSYVTSLETGSASPLNAKSQYQLAQTNYQTDLTKAQGGDATALTALQGYSSAFLSASQNLYGSGAGYASDFNGVVQALGAIANTSQTALTQSFMAAQFTTQTQVLSDQLVSLLAAVKGVQTEIMMQGMAPA